MMDEQTVIFGLKGERYQRPWERAKLKLGTIVHVAWRADGPWFSDVPLPDSEPHGVVWIATSEWYVPLAAGLDVDDAVFERAMSRGLLNLVAVG